MSADLKPCPFCGGAATVGAVREGCIVECNSADCPVNPDTYAHFKHAAIEQWNRRAEPVAQASAVPAVQTMNDRRFSPAYLMYNCRRLLTGSARTTSNWMIAAELFALGSTSAVKLCRDAGIDPDANTVGCSPLTATESNKEPQ